MRYIQLLNDVLELYKNEMSLTLCQIYFQQDAASHHPVGKVQNWLDVVLLGP
jgi:hypothetical protein